RAAESPSTDVLGVTLVYIDQLPDTVKARFDEHFAPEDLQSLRMMHSGLEKLRTDILPNEEELHAISSPHRRFAMAAEGINEAVSHAFLPLEQENFVRTNIVDPLTELSTSFLPEPDCGIVRWWVERILPHQHPSPETPRP